MAGARTLAAPVFLSNKKDIGEELICMSLHIRHIRLVQALYIFVSTNKWYNSAKTAYRFETGSLSTKVPFDKDFTPSLHHLVCLLYQTRTKSYCYGTVTGDPYPSTARNFYGRTRIRVRWTSLVAAVPEPVPAKEHVPQLIPEDIHPFAAAIPANYAPPAVRNAGAKPDIRKRPKDNEPAYRTRAPIEGSHVAREVYERALDSTIMLSHQELYSLSPAIREMIKEDNTKRKVPNTVEQFQKEVALPFTGPETVEIMVKSPENNEDGKTSTLLYSMPTGFVQTFEQTDQENSAFDICSQNRQYYLNDTS
ncbi:hypothetical protein ARMSODRAFT_983959 [Armillaria solidipes]|uniref:Uncharacterized protein n=1 Tax=Armillaria solidipes TaxID=1076256 RepID=A0A2H3ANF3_9AGAR|nr:hypothetical protein ARMSODRAFT_983959 [Armillaria solidipes]